MKLNKIMMFLKKSFISGFITFVLAFLFIYIFAIQIDGLYLLGFNDIYLRTYNHTIYDIQKMSYHEVAHLIWNKCLNSSLKEEYSKLFNKNLCNFPNQPIKEDFAYSYQCYYVECGICTDKYLYFSYLNRYNLRCM